MNAQNHDHVFAVPPSAAERAWIRADQYEEMYRRSISDPEGFWGEEGQRLQWMRPYTKVKNVSYARE
ncbi:MAG: hypothetical protein J0H82_35845, partial [Alphaproteobacteria bacterium]|nr:hypothetical protein [Alphaproteobacteria bacterium]